MNAAIRIRGLHKRYPHGQIALHPFDLDIAAGEIVVLLGPNGAGKSTLFKILATLIHPDGGEAWVAGHPLTAARHVRRHIGVVSEPDRSFFWRLDARQNLEFFARGYGLAAELRDQRIASLLELAQLTPYARRPVGQLSSGQRGRLALARALLHRPPVLLLDEPTRSLDPGAAAEFLTHLQHYRQEMPQASVLLATHRLDAIAPACARALVLRSGHLVADGAPAALMQAAGLPTSPSAAETLARIYTHYTAGEVADAR